MNRSSLLQQNLRCIFFSKDCGGLFDMILQNWLVLIWSIEFFFKHFTKIQHFMVYMEYSLYVFINQAAKLYRQLKSIGAMLIWEIINSIHIFLVLKIIWGRNENKRIQCDCKTWKYLWYLNTQIMNYSVEQKYLTVKLNSVLYVYRIRMIWLVALS